MPALSPAKFIVEEIAGTGSAPDRVSWISEAGGLSQLGAFIETLQPGSRSSVKHWHSAEDELVYVLDGEVTLIEGDIEKLLRPGDGATFAAGVAIGHCLENRSASPTTCLVVGTRAAIDNITYPDRGLVCHRDRGQPDDVWTTLTGEPVTAPHV